MPIINTSIELQDSGANMDYKLVQDKWGISIFTREVGCKYWETEPLCISKNDVGDFIKAMQNLNSNW